MDGQLAQRKRLIAIVGQRVVDGTANADQRIAQRSVQIEQHEVIRAPATQGEGTTHFRELDRTATAPQCDRKATKQACLGNALNDASE